MIILVYTFIFAKCTELYYRNCSTLATKGTDGGIWHIPLEKLYLPDGIQCNDQVCQKKNEGK